MEESEVGKPLYVLPCVMDKGGRILVPSLIRNKLNISPHSNLIITVAEDGKIFIEKSA